MTWFLKSKMKKCAKGMQYHKEQFLKLQKKYQEYAQEQLMENPLLLQLLQQQQNQSQAPQSNEKLSTPTQRTQSQDKPGVNFVNDNPIKLSTTPGEYTPTQKQIENNERMKRVNDMIRSGISRKDAWAKVKAEIQPTKPKVEELSTI